jgi:ribosomal-protein-alanine N-acetyltransferase
MDPILRTSRLTRRALSPEDAAATARIMSPAIARWTGSWTGVETADDVGGRIARGLEAERAGRQLMRAITLSGTGELIGWAGVMRLEAEPERGSLGYWIGEAWFGQGYAKEAARAVLEAAWTALDLQVVEAAAQVANLASHRILLGLGLQPMGRRMEFASARGAADLCDWYELRRA